MSRIGRRPVTVPKGVAVEVQGNTVAVKGPRGELSRTFHPEMQLALRVLDVSIGGCALQVPRDVPALQPGAKLAGVR